MGGHHGQRRALPSWWWRRDQTGTTSVTRVSTLSCTPKRSASPVHNEPSWSRKGPIASWPCRQSRARGVEVGRAHRVERIAVEVVATPEGIREVGVPSVRAESLDNRVLPSGDGVDLLLLSVLPPQSDMIRPRGHEWSRVTPAAARRRSSAVSRRAGREERLDSTDHRVRGGLEGTIYVLDLKGKQIFRTSLRSVVEARGAEGDVDRLFRRRQAELVDLQEDASAGERRGDPTENPVWLDRAGHCKLRRRPTGIALRFGDRQCIGQVVAQYPSSKVTTTRGRREGSRQVVHFVQGFPSAQELVEMCGKDCQDSCTAEVFAGSAYR